MNAMQHEKILKLVLDFNRVLRFEMMLYCLGVILLLIDVSECFQLCCV